MALVIVIVNYRTADLVIDCLESLVPEVEALGAARVVITDNASGDGSVERIEHAIASRGWGRWVSLMPLADNGGFAAGNNAAFRRLLGETPAPDYLMMLNPDTLVRPGAIRELVRFMEANPRAGIAGPRVEFADAAVQTSAFRFPSILGELESTVRMGWLTRLLAKRMVAPPPRETAHTAEWVSGCAMMIRRVVFQRVGLLDEGFFMYFEEVDFCLGAAAAGFERWYVPAARIVHLVGQASGVTDRTKRQPKYWFDARRHFYIKNHGRLYALLADIAFAAGFTSWRLRRRLLRIPDFDPPHLLSDFLCHCFSTGWRSKSCSIQTGSPA